MLYIASPIKLGPALALAPARPSVIMSEGTMAQTYNKAGTTVGSHGTTRHGLPIKYQHALGFFGRKVSLASGLT